MKDLDKKPIADIRRFQQKELATLLSYVQKNSPYYQRVFKEHDIAISSIKEIADLQKIPVTTKDDLFLHNKDFFCVSEDEIIDYITTSGTLGDPVIFAMTNADLDRLAYNECLSFETSGIKKTDIIQLMTTIDRRFMAGLAYFLGARQLGAGIIRVGNGIPGLQWDTIKRMKPNVIVAVPSFILKIIEYAEEKGIDYKNSSVKKAICIGEPLRDQDFEFNKLAKKIKAKWDIQLFSTYASTEMATAFNECEAGKGGHQHPELIIVELLDENNEVVPENQAGEITITTLGVEGMPLLRFKTGDIARAYYEPCSCGRNSMRLGPVMGRRKQMIKYKGTTLYPAALYDVLVDFEDIQDYYVQVKTNDIGTDEVSIHILTTNSSKEYIKNIKDHFRAKLRVAPDIVVVDSQNMKNMKYPEDQRKPRIFIDLRKQSSC
ncbi:MAG: phenylacetate--CoA ligase [Bacteroidetes bacterium 4572_77]|nr:MAG: phenylacetate--CoA ligase [Bacteroidetes bacterium 4572_77]